MMQSEPCRVCGGASKFSYRLKVLGRDVSYFDCPTCGYFQTERPNWLVEAYASPINALDTGIMMRNRANARLTVMTLAAFGRLRGRVVDHAGGYGVLVRLLRDAGVDALWRDKYCDNLLARGFEAPSGSEVDLITAFEVAEHLEEPVAELRSLLIEAPLLLLSTELIATSAPPPPEWWYLGPDHGQHIGFMRARTLAWMSRELGCHHASFGHSIHLLSRAKVPALWSAMLRLNRLAPLVTRWTLSSRVMSDHEFMRQQTSAEPELIRHDAQSSA
jgi:Methyltransferase domain